MKYIYKWSGVRQFQLQENTLTQIKNVPDGDEVIFDYAKSYAPKEYPGAFEKGFYDNVIMKMQ